MDRKFQMTEMEMKFIRYLRKQKTYTNMDYELQKSLLELERNILLGNKSISYFYDNSSMGMIIDDSEVNIVLKITLPNHLTVDISPRPFVKVLPNTKDILNIIDILHINDTVLADINIHEMVINGNFLEKLNTTDKTTVRINNCYLENDVIFPINLGKVDLVYTSIPNINIFSEVSMYSLSIDKCKIRKQLEKENNLLVKKLDIINTTIDYKQFLLLTRLENLEILDVNKKVFNDFELLLLLSAAPNLERVEINSTINNIETLNKIPFDLFYSYDNEYDTEYNKITTISNLKFRLARKPELRELIIRRLEDAARSIYVSNKAIDYDNKIDLINNVKREKQLLEKQLVSDMKEYINSLSKYVNEKEIINLLREPKSFVKELSKYRKMNLEKLNKFIKKSRNKLYESMILNTYEFEKEHFFDLIEKKFNSLSSSFDELFKTKINKEIIRYRENIKYSDIEDHLKKDLLKASFKEVRKIKVIDESKHIDFHLSPIFLPLYNDFDSRDIILKILAPRDFLESEEKHISSYTLYADILYQRMQKIINDYSNKKKQNYDLLEVLEILMPSVLYRYSSNNLVSKFYHEIKLDKRKLNDIDLLLENNASKEEILNKSGFVKLERKSGIILDDYYIREKVYKFRSMILEMSYEKKSLEHFASRVLSRDIKKTAHFNMLNAHGANLYSKYNSLIDKQPEEVNKLFIENSDYNEADYALFKNNTFNKSNNYLYNMNFIILRNFRDKFVNLTKEDYENVKNIVIEKYGELNTRYIDKYNSYIYYELINYITGNYPEYIDRYIKSNINNYKDDSDELMLLSYYKKEEIEAIDLAIEKSKPYVKHYK